MQDVSWVSPDVHRRGAGNGAVAWSVGIESGRNEQPPVTRGHRRFAIRAIGERTGARGSALEHDAEGDRQELRRAAFAEDVVVANLGERSKAAQVELRADTDVDTEVRLALEVEIGIVGVDLRVVHADAADQIRR